MTQVQEQIIKGWFVSQFDLNPNYIKVEQVFDLNEWWVKFPVGITKKNLERIQEKFEIEMIIPTKVNNTDGLDIHIKEKKS